MSKTKSNSIWSDVSEDDFRTDSQIDDSDIADFNKAGMIVYQANTVYARHIARAEDSLKPIERRALYTFFMLDAMPGHSVKSTKITGSLMVIHNHSDSSAYSSIISMGQYWKYNIPLITGNCNLGVITAPDEYAAQRYTELQLTKYAAECFFEDFDKKAINTNALLIGDVEPELLPSKFPNLLINGTSGIGNGFAAYMPPFNVNDVIDVCKKVIHDPDVPVEDLVIAPDFPTDCDIVDNKSKIFDYCTTGRGSVTVRSKIEIEETNSTWVLIIKSLPYGVPFPTIKNKIIELGRAGVIPLKAIHEESEAYVDKDGTTKKNLYFDIEIPKASDPIKVRNILYKNCDLEKTIGLQATVIVNEYKTTIKTMNIKELILAWLNTRRLYKRSIYNHKINQLISTIEIDKAMIVLLNGKNLEKTVDIVRSSTTENIVKRLMTEFDGVKLDSNHATAIAQKPLRAFTKDSAEKYKAELKNCEKQLKEITGIAYDPEKIDEVILKELEDLRKYAPQTRHSKIIKVSNEKEFSASDHRLIITSKGYIKKLPDVVDSRHQKQPYGAFEPNDRILTIDKVNNVDAIILFNAKGRYSVIPIKDIDNTVYNSYGNTLFDISKLDGKIVSTFIIEGKNYKPSMIKDNIVISLSKQGFMKRTQIDDYVSTKDVFKTIKNGTSCKLRDNDTIVQSIVIPTKLCEELNMGVLIFTKHGDYVYLKDYKEISDQSRNASGIQVLQPKIDDECVGFQLIMPQYQKHAIVVTRKGCMKRIELEYLGESKRRKDSSYIATIKEGDEIFDVIAYDDAYEDTTILLASTRNGDKEIKVNTIPVLGRKAKPSKIPGFDNIDLVTIKQE